MTSKAHLGKITPGYADNSQYFCVVARPLNRAWSAPVQPRVECEHGIYIVRDMDPKGQYEKFTRVCQLGKMLQQIVHTFQTQSSPCATRDSGGNPGQF